MSVLPLWRGSVLGLCVITMFLVGGCPLEDPTALGDQQDDDDAGTASVGTVLTVGQLDGDLKDNLQAALTLAPFQGGGNAPILIAADTIDHLTAQEQADIASAFERGFPVIHLRATEAQIEALHDVIGDADYDAVLKDGVERVEIYAVDLDSDGGLWQWMQHTPETVFTRSLDENEDGEFEEETELTVEDSEEQQDARVAYFAQWLADDGQRAEVAGSAYERSKSAALQAAGSYDLATLARDVTCTEVFQQGKNNYSITHYISAYHDLQSGYDLFFITQEAMFAAKGEYRGLGKIDKKYWGNGYGWYLADVRMDTRVSGFTGHKDAVQLLRASPDTDQGVETVTSGFEWGIDAELSYSQKDGAGGKVGGHFTYSDSRSFQVKDCNVENQCGTEINNAAWRYDFKRCEHDSSHMGVPRTTKPPRLATSTFKPVNMWVFRTSPNVRAKRAPLELTVDVTLEQDQSDFNFWLFLRVIRDYWRFKDTLTIALRYPPIVQ